MAALIGLGGELEGDIGKFQGNERKTFLRGHKKRGIEEGHLAVFLVTGEREREGSAH